MQAVRGPGGARGAAPEPRGPPSFPGRLADPAAGGRRVRAAAREARGWLSPLGGGGVGSRAAEWKLTRPGNQEAQRA